MNRQPVQSSNIASIGYDKESKTLEIEFLNGGIYQYNDVSENIYKRLMSAESKGKFFITRIRNNPSYAYRKV